MLNLQDSPDPLANSLLQPQFPGTLVLELDWLHLRTHKDDPLVLCIAGADSSFRLVEVSVYVSAKFRYMLCALWPKMCQIVELSNLSETQLDSALFLCKNGGGTGFLTILFGTIFFPLRKLCLARECVLYSLYIL